MATRFSYRCVRCGAKGRDQSGRCPSCGLWAVMRPEIEGIGARSRPKSLEEVSRHARETVLSSHRAWDEVIGGLLPRGSILFGGDSGLGKSTLLLELAGAVSSSGKRAIYVTAEEDEERLALRADRLGIHQRNVTAFGECSLDHVLSYLGEHDYALVIVDSIQTISLDSCPLGDLGGMREGARLLRRWAQDSGGCVVIVCHVTKDGDLAGPKALEHYVDAVVELRGKRSEAERTLVAIKNRAGPTPKTIALSMTERGLALIGNPE